ncbi:MAG: hypothetical protein ACYTF1_12885 [Planctomycetota bacterium]
MRQAVRACDGHYTDNEVHPLDIPIRDTDTRKTRTYIKLSSRKNPYFSLELFFLTFELSIEPGDWLKITLQGRKKVDYRYFGCILDENQHF